MERLKRWVLWLGVLLLAWTGAVGDARAEAPATGGTAYMSVAHAVKTGETLYGIAKTYYLTSDYARVAAVNGWDARIGLKAGATVVLRNPLVLDQYAVKAGDTLYAITNRYFNRGQYMNALMAYNGITDADAGLKAGVELRVPLTIGERRHVVVKGDTLYSLSTRYFNAQDYLQAIAQYNGIRDEAGSIQAGQVLQIPNPFYNGPLDGVDWDAAAAAVAAGIGAGAGASGAAAGTGTTKPPATAGAGTTSTSAAAPAKPAAVASAKPASSTSATAAPAKPAVATTAAKPTKAATYAIEINVSRNKLYVRAGGVLQRSFDIASGKKAGLTPTGTFEIILKIKNPWYSAKSIPGGNPKNPLGSRWLGLDVPKTQGTTYGIHGTNAPSSIGTNASAGCIRMNNKDVEWLFDSVPTGTKVWIHA